MTLGVHPDEIVRNSTSALLAVHPSWERVRLGEVADVLNGFAFKSAEFSHDRGMPLLRIRDVGSDQTQVRFAGEFNPHYLVEPGTIVVGMDGDFRVARWRGEPALLNQRVCALKIRNAQFYDEDFLLYVLPGYLDAIHRATSSITVKHLSSETVKQIPLPLPPFSEQRRIVTGIEERLLRLDSAETSLSTARARGDTLRRRTLAWDDCWTPIELSEVGAVVTGTTPSTKNPAYWGGDVPFITPGDYEFGERVVSARRALTASGAEAARIVPSEAVLVTCIGATTGKVGLASRECAINQQINAVIADAERVLPGYLFLACLRSEFQRSVWAAAASTTLPILNKTKFGRLSVPLPPLEAQEAIVRDYERASVAAATVETTVAVATGRALALRRALLAEAFCGKLLTQDPIEEPASALLARIEAARVAAPPSSAKQEKASA